MIPSDYLSILRLFEALYGRMKLNSVKRSRLHVQGYDNNDGGIYRVIINPDVEYKITATFGMHDKMSQDIFENKIVMNFLYHKLCAEFAIVQHSYSDGIWCGKTTLADLSSFLTLLRMLVYYFSSMRNARMAAKQDCIRNGMYFRDMITDCKIPGLIEHIATYGIDTSINAQTDIYEYFKLADKQWCM